MASIVVVAVAVQRKTLFSRTKKDAKAAPDSAQVGANTADGPAIGSVALGLCNALLGLSYYFEFRPTPRISSAVFEFFYPGAYYITSVSNNALYFLIMGAVGALIGISGLRTTNKKVAALGVLLNIAAVVLWLQY